MNAMCDPHKKIKGIQVMPLIFCYFCILFYLKK